MIKNRFFTAGIYSRIFLLKLIPVIAVFVLAGCYTAKKNSSTAVEMVVVFKVDVPVEKASSILFEKEYIFHEGMDSSRGKKYFQETGPKYIVIVPKEKIADFNLQMKDITQIYEIYQADWTVNKD